jgi:hypothetical protein
MSITELFEDSSLTSHLKAGAKVMNGAYSEVRWQIASRASRSRLT